VPVLGVEAAEEVEHLTGLADELTNITKGIRQLLEAPSVLCDIHVALHQIPKFHFQVDCPVELIVTELLLDAGPDDVRRWLGNTDDGEDILGNGVVDPAEDALVDDAALQIAGLRWGRRRGELV
jgi:hypothetical protein